MGNSPDKPGGNTGLTRRAFLGTTAGAGAVSFLGKGEDASAKPPAPASAVAIPAPTAAQLARDTGSARPPTEIRAAKRPGSDLMVQILKDLGIEFIVANPASSFEGLQESIVNYGDPPNTMPELISALHEESAIDMAHGYAKAEGKPLAVMLHGTVGTMHASMAIYQAYHNRVPMVLIIGRDDTFFLQQQSANDIAGIVRAITKWDAQPTTLEDSLVAIQRAYSEAMTPPCGPTVVVIDTELQKEEAGDMALPIYHPPIIATISESQARKIASDLINASNPRIHVGRLRTPAGVDAAIELAELVGASVKTDAARGPMSFPQRHPQCGMGATTSYDYTLGLETAAEDVVIIGPHIRSIPNRDVTEIGFGGVRDPVIERGSAPAGAGDRIAATLRANDIRADAEASIPLITAEATRLLTASKRTVIAARVRQHGKANHDARIRDLEKALESKRKGWDGSPISTARLYADLWPLIMDEDWCLASPTVFSSRHHVQLWDHNKPYSYLGMHGAGGIGYCIGASAGAGLAARERNRIVINIQCDGDLNYAPGSLWTAAHHRLPMLTIMHNNRAWHQEVMYLHYMAGVRGRGTDRSHIGTTLRDPFIDYAKMAEAYGVESEGPISDPAELVAAYERGIAAVKEGRPYLIDVLTQPR